MYTLYHIPNKKWGLTKRKVERRLWEQGYSISDIDRIITVDNIDKASEMEEQLNIEYGYSWKKSENYKHITKIAAGNRKCSWSNDDRMRGALKGGRTAVSSGQLKSVCSDGGKVGGKIIGNREHTCPHCGHTQKGNGIYRNHFDKCKLI
jgi:hypothetical protein